MDITLRDGKVITVDVSALTVAEWRKFVLPGSTVKDEDAVVAKCTGLSEVEIAALNFQDFRRIVQAVVKQASEPLANPT